MKIEPEHLYIWSISTAMWRISSGYWLSFSRNFLFFYLFLLFYVIRSMLREQEDVHSVICPFRHVVYAGEWFKIPQRRLSGRAGEDHCPWYNVLCFLAEVTVDYRHFFSKIF